jgi:hypothetical protein
LTRLDERMTRIGLRHIVAAAALVRIVFALTGYLHANCDPHVFFQGDTNSYLEPAREMVTHLRFYNAEGPETFRTPGYCVLLAAALVVGHLEFAVVLQFLLSLVTLYLVYRTSKLLFEDEAISLLAATLYALEPLSIFYVSQLYSETMFTAFFMAWLYFQFRYLKRQRSGDLILSGAALAASIYVRPIVYFLPEMVVAGLILREAKSGRRVWKPFVMQLALFVIVTIGPIVLWQVRNKIETGFGGFSTVSSENMYFYQGASVLAEQQLVPFEAMQRQLGFGPTKHYLSVHPEQATWTVAAKYQYMLDEGLRVVREHPFAYARIHLAGMVMIVFSSGINAILKFFRAYPSKGSGGLRLADWGMLAQARFMFAHPTVLIANALLLPVEIAYLLLAAVGLSDRDVRRKPEVWVIILVFAYYVVMSGGPGGESRFRVPLMPMLCLIGAIGLKQIDVWLRARGYSSLSAPNRSWIS